MQKLKTGIILLLGLGLAACAPKSQEFTSTEGWFSILAPVALTAAAQKADEPPLHYYSGTYQDHLFSITYRENPANLEKISAQATLDTGRNEELGANGSLRTEKEIQIEGHPGRELMIDSKINNDRLEKKAEVFIIGHRLYKLQVTGPAGRFNAALADGFLKSLKLHVPPQPDPSRTVEYKSEEAHFSVMTWVPFKETKIPQNPPLYKHDTYEFMGDEDGQAYAVICAQVDLPPQTTPEAALNLMSSKMTARDQVQVLSVEKITLKDVPGLAMSISQKNAEGMIFTRVRIYLSGGWIYTVEATVEKGREFNQDTNQFLESFKILPGS